MFKKNTSNIDIKKSQQKCLDSKKDNPTRLKHLRAVLENGDSEELKLFLESHYSVIFHVFFDSFLCAEANLKQKGAFAQRNYKEDLDCCLFVLDRIFCLIPDLVRQKWQCNALTHIFKKLLHPGNTIKYKGEAMRLFLLWYMIVGETRTTDMDCMFASLVHGFPVPPPPIHEIDASNSKVTSGDYVPLIMPSSAEKTPDDLSAYMLRSLLEYMVSQTRRIDWKEQKSVMHSRCFSHIFGMFRSIYLPYIFPQFNPRLSIYKPTLDLPELRLTSGINNFGSCPVVLIEWVKKYIAAPRKVENREDDGRKSAHSEVQESNSDQDSISSAYYVSSDDSWVYEDRKMVHESLLGLRENVNFIHEIFRQALRLCFRYSSAMKTVVQCYTDWIKMCSIQNGSSVPLSEMPSFLMEPNVSDNEIDPMRRLRNDSYIGAISSEYIVRAGLQNVLQVFVTSASNAFLLVVSADFPRLLDEQVDLCKLILNIYRYMVMNTKMEQRTWEQLLLVLFHITSKTLSGKPNKTKGDSLGRRFASALFQTLVVSCIKANLSVIISTDLWDQLLATLINLTHWEELIKEWAKTMDTLTKVLARHVYGLELDNLPLDRLTERKALKRAATKISAIDSNRNTLSRVLDHSKGSGPGVRSQSGFVHPSNPNNIIDNSKLGHDKNFYNRKRRSSMGSTSSQKLSGISDAFVRSESYPYDYSDGHSVHHQYRDGYFRHHVYSSKRKMFKALSDPNLHRRNYHEYNDRLSRLVMASRSLDFIPYGAEEYSRSASPAPSSGMETTSLKESPLQMDFGGDNISIDTLEGGLSCEQRSVMAGGTVRGWLPDVSVILWRRVLGLLGDPNDTTSPSIHEQIFKYLLELTDKLLKLRDNQGISIDNQTTPPTPDLVPPLLLLAPWCFKAISLPAQFSNGKLLAYKILCRMLVRKQDVSLPKELLAHFYRVLHAGLVGPEQEIISTLVGGCSPNFFSLGLPGSSMLALDFIYATNTVISSGDHKLLNSRFDALSLLGSLYPLASLCSSMPVLQPSPSDFTLIKCSEVKDHLITVLLKCSKKDNYSKTRSLSLCALSIYLYHELSSEQHHHKVPEAVNVILASLKLPTSSHATKYHNYQHAELGRLVSQVSSDLLLLLADFSDVLLANFPDLPPKIIQALCQALSSVSGDEKLLRGREGQFLALSLLFCLGEWVMKLPHEVLIKPPKPVLLLVFKVLHVLANGGKAPQVSKVETTDIDINLKEEPSIDSSTLRRSNFNTIQLAARAITNHLVNHLWHFPLGVGAQRLSSVVMETDDLPGFSTEELTSDIFSSPHVQLFALNHTCLLSLIQLPALHVPGGASTLGFKTPSSEVRLILRDLSGKFSWDASTLYAPPLEDLFDCSRKSESPPLDTCSVPSPVNLTHRDSRDEMSSSIMVMTSPPRHALRHRPTGILPSVEDSADDLDNLDDLLSYIRHTSPEIVDTFGQLVNSCVGPPGSLPVELQTEAISAILNQRNSENEYLVTHAQEPNMVCPPEECPAPLESENMFHECRKIFDQLGLASFEKRQSIHTLRKNEKLLREIKNLDNQKCRETHKVAVIFVAEGQEDKVSILGNSAGSEGFEEFVSGLGWEIELASHSGFLGGLQRNGSTGETAPYYATSLTEVVFHVSTRMPSTSEESSFQKVRHLGNDEVHIVWSEHWRDYRRGIIPTEFCDVLIIIYPIENRLFRIQVSTKPEVPLFGPLFDGAIVNRRVLSKLVRATAINASRAKRSRLPMYQHFYEERARSLETIIENHSEATTFEHFLSDIYTPISQSVNASSFASKGGSTSTNLAAALIDDPSPRPPLTRPTSYSVGEHHNVREKARNALGNESHSGVGDSSDRVSMSPRNLKKHSFKAPRKIAITSALAPTLSASAVSPVAPPRKHKEYGGDHK